MGQNIILLFGGDSDERLVSVASAQAMAEAISAKTLWFWHKDGPVYQINSEELLAHKNPFTHDFLPKNNPLFNDIESAIKSSASNDSVFLLGLHGGRGENGYVQELLERYHRPFTGSDAKASARAFNKISTKKALMSCAIKMAPHIIIETHELAAIKRMLEDFLQVHKKIIVKPISGGSSLGCFFIYKSDEIASVASELVRQNRPFMAEKIIEGREITLGVITMKEPDPFALIATEIIVDTHRSFDYEGKYLGAGTKEITPAILTPLEMLEAQAIAKLAHQSLGLRGYSRTDLILAADGFYYLETNTLPGLSRTSLLPQQLALFDISLREFLMRQIENAALL